MKNLVLVKRYCHGLLGALHDEDEYGLLFSDLESFARLMKEQKELRAALTTPFLPASKKQKITHEILQRLSLQPKSVRFLQLLVENDRLGLLNDILELLPDLWNQARGVATFDVFSVVPLTPKQQRRLQDKLEDIEQGPVALKFRRDPSLIAGLSLRRGNMVYDVSLQGSLERLKEKIIEG